jgi:hypothetical protein
MCTLRFLSFETGLSVDFHGRETTRLLTSVQKFSSPFVVSSQRHLLNELLGHPLPMDQYEEPGTVRRLVTYYHRFLTLINDELVVSGPCPHLFQT